jgi:transposase
MIGGRPKPWDVDDELWALIEPLLPKVERRIRHPGRKRHPDRLVFQASCSSCTPGGWVELPQVSIVTGCRTRTSKTFSPRSLGV